MAKKKYNGIELNLNFDAKLSSSKLLEVDQGDKYLNYIFDAKPQTMFAREVIVEPTDYIQNNFEAWASVKTSNHLPVAKIYEDLNSAAVEVERNGFSKPNEVTQILEKSLKTNSRVGDVLVTIGYIQTFTDADTRNKVYVMFPGEKSALQAPRISFENYMKKHKVPVLIPTEALRDVTAIKGVYNMRYQINNGGITQYYGNNYNESYESDGIKSADKEEQVACLKNMIVFAKKVYPEDKAEEIESLEKWVETFESTKIVKLDNLEDDEKEGIVLDALESASSALLAITSDGSYDDDFLQYGYMRGAGVREQLEKDFEEENDDGDRVNEDGETVEDVYGISIDDIDDDTLYRFEPGNLILEEVAPCELGNAYDVNELAYRIASDARYLSDVQGELNLDDEYFIDSFNGVLTAEQIDNIDQKFYETGNFVDNLLDNYAQYIAKKHSLIPVEKDKVVISPKEYIERGGKTTSNDKDLKQKDDKEKD